MKTFHFLMTVAWLIMVPVAYFTHWIESLVFISACSIYANAASHFAAWQGVKAEKEAQS